MYRFPILIVIFLFLLCDIQSNNYSMQQSKSSKQIPFQIRKWSFKFNGWAAMAGSRISICI